MQVKVEEIRDSGLTLNERVSEELLTSALEESGHETGFHPLGPAQLQATFKKVSGGVLLNGKVTPKLAAPCKRCLAEVKFEVPVSFTLNLIPESQLKATDELGEGEDDEESEESGSFDLNAADQEVFDGKTIDLDPIVREQVLLALPMNVVCREDCKGLCAVCGEDRNTKDCGHEQRVLDPRLAALKDIKLKPN
jgi:uncharacterized protein